MIVKNDQLQCLECNICGDVVELPCKALRDAELVFFMKEHMTQDHKPCEPYKGDRAKAVAARSFHVRLQAEMRQLDEGKDAGKEGREKDGRKEESFRTRRSPFRKAA